MTAALHLVCDYGFEVAGLRLIRWRAVVGNWASRRVAANVGFVFDGTVRSLLVQRGELRDGWIATLVRDDPRLPQPWLQPIEMDGRRPAASLPQLRRRPHRRSLLGPRHGILARLDAAAVPASQRLQLSRLDRRAGRAPGRCCLVYRGSEDDRCLGSISLDGLNGYAKRGEIGYWAHPDARGRGVVTEAVRSGDPARRELRTGELAHDSLRGKTRVATCGRTGRLHQNRSAAHVGTAGRRQLADLVLSPPAALRRTSQRLRRAPCCGKICG